MPSSNSNNSANFGPGQFSKQPEQDYQTSPGRISQPLPPTSNSQNPGQNSQYFYQSNRNQTNQYFNQPSYRNSQQYSQPGSHAVNTDTKGKLNQLEEKFHVRHFKTFKKPHVLITAIALSMVVIIGIVGLVFGFWLNRNPLTKESISNSVASQDFQFEFNDASSRAFSPRTFVGIFTNKSLISGDSNSSSSTNSQVSFSSVAPLFQVSLAPLNLISTNRTVSQFQVCGDGIQLVSGVATFTKSTIPAQTMTVVHRNLFASALDQSQFQLATNYIAGQTDILSDGNTDSGPDILQVLRTNCVKSLVNQIQPIESLSYPRTDAWRGTFNLSGNKEFPSVTIDIYAIKGDYMIRLSQSFDPKNILTSAQIQNCTKFTVMDRACLIDVIKKDNIAQKKLEESTKALVQNFAL